MDTRVLSTGGDEAHGVALFEAVLLVGDHALADEFENLGRRGAVLSQVMDGVIDGGIPGGESLGHPPKS